MEIGKIPNDILKNIVLDKIKINRKEVLLRPKIGEDCCAVDFGKDVCVMSTDPITGTVNEIGRLAVHISCNDIASCGAEPIGILVTILVPPDGTKEELESIMAGLCETANSLNVDIIGGHTEITDAVNRFVITATAVGKIIKDKLVSTSGARPYDDVIITKSAGVEGTAIIAHDKEEELIQAFGKSFVNNAKNYINHISVFREGIISGEYGVNAMHDITEGGVLGAAWELSEASGLGIEIYKDKIPVRYETRNICQYYNIDPLKLISSGSMIISCENGKGLIIELAKNGIDAAIIGKMVTDNRKTLICEGTSLDIKQPESDELYKVL